MATTAKRKEKTISKHKPINLGIVGHVDHGKTSLTQSLSGKWTDTHSEEIRKGITIRLGYADFSVYKCESCKDADAYSTKEKCKCGKKGTLQRRISIVDAPGHESLMATMLSGAAIIDGALLMIAANEPCPQPQTREHLVALQIIGIKNVVVVQNKIDLVTEKGAKENYAQIKAFLKDTEYAKAPIIPVSAQRLVNLDALIEAIEQVVPEPLRDEKAETIMLVARSFDINKPGIEVQDLVGGVLGGALKQGSLHVNDEIELRPGIMSQKHGNTSWESVITKIVALKSSDGDVKELGPGGSIGVMTSLDPSIVKSDAFTGSLVGIPGKLPPTLHEISLEVNLLDRVVGARDELVVAPIKVNENLMLNVNSAATVGLVRSIKRNIMSCSLKIPVCASRGSRFTISRLLGSRWRLIGYGILM